MDTKTGELLTDNIAGVNRILPHKHKYAWDLFLKSCANNWMPTEISMQNDIKQWKNNEITDDEKLLVKNAEEYTSPISKIYKVAGCYIICTENSIYIVSESVSTRRIS